jgi:hypothetical protein
MVGTASALHFQTTAAAEVTSDSSSDAWRENDCITSHEFKVDSDNSSTSIDFCEPNSGIYPSENGKEVEINWDAVAQSRWTRWRLPSSNRSIS